MTKKIIIFITGILFCLAFTQMKAACGITATSHPDGIAKQIPGKDFFITPGPVHVQCNSNAHGHFFIKKDSDFLPAIPFFYTIVTLPDSFPSHTGYLLHLFPSHYFW